MKKVNRSTMRAATVGKKISRGLVKFNLHKDRVKPDMSLRSLAKKEMSNLKG